MDKRSVTAWLMDCKPDELVNLRDYGDRVTVLNAAGQKFTFTEVQLAKAEEAMHLTPSPSPGARPPREGSKATVAKKRTRKSS